MAPRESDQLGWVGLRHLYVLKAPQVLLTCSGVRPEAAGALLLALLLEACGSQCCSLGITGTR